MHLNRQDRQYATRQQTHRVLPCFSARKRVGTSLITAALISILAATLSGCTSARPPVSPVTTKYFPSADSPSAALLVLLPGIHDAIETFERQGFIDAVQQSGYPCDILSVDAHYGFYEAGTIVERLHDDVIVPARQAGHTNIRLVGISLGGFGALMYAQRHASEVDTLVLLAPYLGDEDIIQSLATQDKLADWQPQDSPDDQTAQRIWLQLKDSANRPADYPDINLGYGTADKFWQAHALLASTLPKDHVLTVAGGHNWTTWKLLWDQMLVQYALCKAGTE